MSQEQMKNPRILIGTLYSGENEFDSSVESLESQSYTNWDQVVFKNLPNVLAHQRLYQRFMDAADQFDLFLKLDADMVFSENTALEKIVQLFREEKELDHALIGLRDWFSNTDIMGLNVFTARARWEANGERLFVDHPPRITGIRKVYWGPPAPIADHAPDPSLEEAVQFGMHRALKIVQRGQRTRKPTQALLQYTLLQSVWREYLRSGDSRRVAALLGAESVFVGTESSLKLKGTNDSVSSVLELLHSKSESELAKLLEGKWGTGVRAQFRNARWVRLPLLASRVKMAAKRHLKSASTDKDGP